MIKLTDVNIFPLNADHINMVSFGGDIIELYQLEDKYINKDTDEPLYSVGLISDVHYNDHESETPVNPENEPEEDGSHFSKDLLNALTYFNNNNIDLICCSGDITTDDAEHLTTVLQGIEYWAEHNDTDAPTIASCLGNHDWKAITASGSNEEWQFIPEYATKMSSGYSFYFTKNDDLFIFLSVGYNGNYNHAADDLLYYNPDDLLDLTALLGIYLKLRIFIFTHYFFPDMAGNPNEYYTGNHGDTYVLSGDLLDKLKSLITPNTIWFSGHSHYHWDALEEDVKANVAYDNGWAVHIPSLARPIKCTEDYQLDLLASEGGILEVHKDYVIISGVIFANNDGEYINKKSMYAQYKIEIPNVKIENESTFEGTLTTDEDEELNLFVDGGTEDVD